MTQTLTRLKETASQTAGPYVHIGLTPNYAEIHGIYSEDLGISMVNEKTKGERITVTMRLFDGTGSIVRDAVIELWQADTDGLYNSPSEPRGKADPNFTGWGRQASDGDGVFTFETVKPGRVPFPGGALQAPHLTLWIVARGINLGLQTRMYFADEQQANAEDPVLTRLEHQNRVATLIAPRNGNTYTFDIHLQGEKETVFFDV